MHDPNTLPPLSDDLEQALTEGGANDETRYMARKYYPIAWGKVSPYSTHNHPISTWGGLWNHVREAEKNESKEVRIEDMRSRTEARKLRKQKSEQGAVWVAWTNNCTARNVWIEESNTEWRRRVAHAKAEKAKLDAFVEEARLEYQSRKAVPAPARPDGA